MSYRVDAVEEPEACSHFVQVYATGQPLVQSVGRYLAAGLRCGASQLLVATRDHSDAFCREIMALGVDSAAAMNEGRLRVLDAAETLSRLMSHGQPDRSRFRQAITEELSRLPPAPSGAVVRVYGEMVGLLWNAGNYSAAIQLEELWSELLPSLRFSLYCSYPIDIFGEHFHMAGVHALLCDHTHLLPSGDEQKLNRAIDLAMEAILGSKRHEVRAAMAARDRPSGCHVPEAETAILWIRKNLPGQAEQILQSARDRFMAMQPAYPQ